MPFESPSPVFQTHCSFAVRIRRDRCGLYADMIVLSPGVPAWPSPLTANGRAGPGVTESLPSRWPFTLRPYIHASLS
jgi:hypothetical protein